MPLAHGVLARNLQDAAVVRVYTFLVASRSREFEADTVRQFLSVEVGGVGGFEVREVEFLARSALGEMGLLGCRRREVDVTGFVERKPAAFPKLFEGWVVSFGDVVYLGM